MVAGIFFTESSRNLLVLSSCCTSACPAMWRAQRRCAHIAGHAVSYFSIDFTWLPDEPQPVHEAELPNVPPAPTLHPPEDRACL